MGILSALPFIGGIADTIIGARQANKNIDLQKQFAKSGIQWKVEDAKKAGIHPLYALGAQTHSFSPVTVGTDFAGVGQDISRSIDATRTATQRMGSYDKTIQDLSLTRMGLENELLRSQIAKVRGQVGPPMAGSDYLIPGQSGSGVVLNPLRPPDDQPVGAAVNSGPWRFDPGTASAQVMEDRYGEGSDWFYGPYAFWKDIGYNNLWGGMAKSIVDRIPPDWRGRGLSREFTIPRDWSPFKYVDDYYK